MSHKASFTKSFLIAIIALILNTLSLNSISQNVGYDVYSAGYYSSNGKNRAAIYKNNEKLYTIENGPNTNAMNLTVSPNGDIYWLMKATDYNSVIYYIYKNENKLITLDTKTHVCGIYFKNDVLYLSGYQTNENGVNVATVWEGEDMTVYQTFGDGMHGSFITSSTTNGDDAYHCGRMIVNDTMRGAVWKNDELLSVYNPRKSYFTDIAVDGDKVYTLGVRTVYTYDMEIYSQCIWLNNNIQKEVGSQVSMSGLTAFNGDYYHTILYPHEQYCGLIKNTTSKCSWITPDGMNGVTKMTNYYGEPWFCGAVGNGAVWKGNCDRILQPEGCKYVNDFQIVEKEYPVIGAEWYYEIAGDDGNVTYQYLQCSSDTTVNHKDVKIILRTNTLYDKDLHKTTSREYVYGENGIVYWWNKDLQEFTTLYDFNANAGDEWELKVGLQNITVHVDSVATYEHNDEIMKMLIVSDINNYFSGNIICNVGHTTSFFPEKLMNRGDSKYEVDGIRCYWIDGKLKYSDDETDCEKIYSVEENEINYNDYFKIYPNPTNGSFILETESNATFKITNIVGQTIISGNLETGTNSIDVNGLNDGIYFITSGNATKKLVIKR